MVSGCWPTLDALGYGESAHRSYSRRFYDWLIDNVLTKKPFFEKSHFLGYLRLSVLIFFTWTVYSTLKNLYQSFVFAVDGRKAPGKDSCTHTEALVDALEISFEENTKNSTPQNIGRFCADPFKRQIHELMKEYKKDVKKDIKEKLKNSGFKRDGRSLEGTEDDDEDDEEDDVDDGKSADERTTIKERTTDESSRSTVSSIFLKSEQGSYHECPLCNMPLRTVEITFDERTSYPEDPSVCDSNSLRFSSDNPKPYSAKQDDSTSICLIGSFTNWSTKLAMPISIAEIYERKTMAEIIDPNLKDKTATIKLMLPRGHHEFKFLKNDKKYLSPIYDKCHAFNREDQFNFIDVE